MAYRPSHEDELPAERYRPPEIQPMTLRDVRNEIDLYNWLLQRLERKCLRIGIQDPAGAVSIMKAIFKEGSYVCMYSLKKTPSLLIEQ